MKKYALIWCSESALLDYRHQMLNEFRTGDQHWDVLSPAADNFLEQVLAYDGYVVSGSEKSVVDDGREVFVERILAALRHIRAHSVAPIVGICFGAQALAQAFGGQVGRNPSGQFRLGVETLQWTEAARKMDQIRDLGAPVLAQSHGECVMSLPPGSLKLASSPSAVHEIFLLENRFLGIQGHPEVDNDGLKTNFMPLHQRDFDELAWQAVRREADIPVLRAEILALCRQLLSQGTFCADKRSGAQAQLARLPE